ncbi:MAG TPA: DUF3995 domain-containing protein [Acidimicrobiales bacterium]|nr:DUF3995 domain-containing protein [Acidimicrobiales bacterium]
MAALAAIVAGLSGLANAGMSAYWAAGRTGLADTIGGDIERWGRERGQTVVATLWVIVAVKTAVAIAAPVLVGLGGAGLPSWTTGRVPRALGWIAAAVLTVYGAAPTIAGLLAEVVEASADAAPKGPAWHAYLWDPWSFAWGLAFLAALSLTRPRRDRPDRPSTRLPGSSS